MAEMPEAAPEAAQVAPEGDALTKIVDLFKQMSPEEQETLLEALASARGVEEQEPEGGIVSPEAGVKGVPVNPGA